MGIKIDGGSAVQPENDVLECREPPPTRSSPSQTNSTPAQNSVAPFKGPPEGSSAIPGGPVCEGGPTFKAGELLSQVELCKRAADIPFIGQLGAKHHWLQTPGKQVGMGERPGQIPGHGEPPPVGQATQWVDHSKEKDKECVVVPEVDVACVERETEFGKDTGNWWPFVNDCHTKTQEVLDKCSTRQSGPDFGDPKQTGAGHTL